MRNRDRVRTSVRIGIIVRIVRVRTGARVEVGKLHSSLRTISSPYRCCSSHVRGTMKGGTAKVQASEQI